MRARRCLEISLVVAIVISVWLLLFLPVVIYFRPLNHTGRPSSDQKSQWNSTIFNLDKANSSSASIQCTEDYFMDREYNASSWSIYSCKPECSTWIMFSRTAETASLVVIGAATVVGILTTTVIILLSFVRFRNMLTFPSVLVLYQDIVVSAHGICVLIGLADRRLFCTSKDLVETFISDASLFCNISGILSSFMCLPLTVWIAIQISYTFLAIYAPMYFKRLKQKKQTSHSLHILSILAGLVSLLFPSLLTLGLGGYSPLDTKFPPVVCFPENREITMYIYVIPVEVMIAIIITELILIFHFLLRNTCMKRSHKDLKKAEAKVIIICCCYVVLGLAASFSFSFSSSSLPGLKRELMDHFECERVGDGENPDQLCDKSGFERFINPAPKILAYTLLALYPLITLIYFLHKKKKANTKNHNIMLNSNSTTSKNLSRASTLTSSTDLSLKTIP